jgi:DNA-binding MarR family transcriptional regulator
MSTTDPQISLKKQPPRPPKELICSPAFLLKRLGFALKERSLEVFAEAGLSPYHHAVLSVLDEEPRETQAMIADALGYDRSHLVGILDELEEQGLVARRRDPTDRRRHLVTLTPEGKAALKRVRSISKAIEDEFFGPLDAEQRAQLHSLLLELAVARDPRLADYAPTR